MLQNQDHLFSGDWLGEKFRKYIRIKPDDSFPYYLYAVSLLKQNKTQRADRSEAIKLLRKALELSPKLPEAHLELGKIYFDDKQYQQAILEYEKAIRIKPDLEGYYRLAQAYGKVGNQEKARQASDLALALQKELEAEATKREKQILRFVYTLK